MGVGKSTFVFTEVNDSSTTKNSITIDGESVRIGITRDNQSYNHKLLHGYDEIATLAAGTYEYVWTPTASQLTKFWEEVPTQKTRQIDVYLDTYDGTTFVGRDIHALTVTLSEETGKPNIGNISITDSNTKTSSWGIIIPGESQLKISFTGNNQGAKYGANLKLHKYVYEGKEYYLFDSLIASIATSTPASHTIEFVEIDSRGFSASKNVTITVATYDKPVINSFEVIRCDVDGNESNDGDHAKFKISGSWSYLGGVNNINSFYIYRKGQNDNGWAKYNKVFSEWSSTLNGTITINDKVDNVLVDPDTDYNFKVGIIDDYGNTYETDIETFSNSQSILYVSADGSEIIFGGNASNHVVIDPDSVDIKRGSETLATFGNETYIGDKDKENIKITPSGINVTYAEKYLHALPIDSGSGYGDPWVMTYTLSKYDTVLVYNINLNTSENETVTATVTSDKINRQETIPLNYNKYRTIAGFEYTAGYDGTFTFTISSNLGTIRGDYEVAESITLFENGFRTEKDDIHVPGITYSDWGLNVQDKFEVDIGGGVDASRLKIVDGSDNTRITATPDDGGSWIHTTHVSNLNIPYLAPTSSSTAQGYMSMKTASGSWAFAGLGGSNDLYLKYGTDANYTARTNTTSGVTFHSDGTVGLSNSFSVTAHQVLANSQTIASKGYLAGSYNISKSGWYPLAIVGWNTNNRYVNPIKLYINNRSSGSGTIQYGLGNPSAVSAGSTVGLNVDVLWVRV